MLKKAATVFAIQAALLGASTIAVASPKTIHVKIEGVAFIPAKVDANVGDTVVWENADLVPHTVTSKTKAFDSGTLAVPSEGKKPTWKHTFTKKGDFDYVCSFHPTMQGKVVVK